MLSLNVGEGRGSRRPVRQETDVDVSAGDRWEWTINALASATRAENDVTYRRISGGNQSRRLARYQIRQHFAA